LATSAEEVGVDDDRSRGLERLLVVRSRRRQGGVGSDRISLLERVRELGLHGLWGRDGLHGEGDGVGGTDDLEDGKGGGGLGLLALNRVLETIGAPGLGIDLDRESIRSRGL
jgi:hypothetical protein